MLISNERILQAVAETLERMLQRGDLPREVAYDLDVAAISLRHLLHVEVSEGDDMRDFAKLGVALRGAGINSDLVTTLESSPLAGLRGTTLKQGFVGLIEQIDASFAQAAMTDPDQAKTLLSRIALDLLDHHGKISLIGTARTAQDTVSLGAALTDQNLTAYLQHRLADPTASVSQVTVLNGGFGKETTLFHLRSGSINGDLVVRRDSPIELFEGLDCHTAQKEFPLLKAMYGAGFPVPEPLVCEPGTAHIPGPAFTIMRRAPGAVSGDALGGQGKVPAPLQLILATVTARLHSMSIPPGLEDNPAFSPKLLAMTVQECARYYIERWYRYYLRQPHLPMPAMHGLLNWLLDHVPASDATPTLVHGDIGFHNLLFNDGELSAVLDWEYAHIGDPAEDLGYIRAMMGAQLDWDAFVASYVAAGGTPPDEDRVRFFEIWSHVRNAVSILLAAEHFESGSFRDIKYNAIVYRHLPHFVAEAERLIKSFPRS